VLKAFYLLRSAIAWSKFRIRQQLDHHKGFQVHNLSVFLELTGESNYVAVRLNRLLHLVRGDSNQGSVYYGLLHYTDDFAPYNYKESAEFRGQNQT
jgi:hypothetical protein